MDKPAEIEFAWLLFGGVGAMLLLAGSVAALVLASQRRAFRQRARLQQLELDYQKALLHSVVGSQESERERITRDLHDEIGASLSVAKLFVNQIRYESPSADVARLAEQASEVISETVQNIRALVQNLSPANINQLGLRRAIEIALQRLEVAGLRVQARLDPGIDDLGENLRLALYRIVQEVVGNIVKHAQAHHVVLTLERQGPAELWLSVADDGRGFELPTPGGPAAGMGLGGMRARAGMFGGQLTVESALGQGTRVTLRLPLPAAAPES